MYVCYETLLDLEHFDLKFRHSVNHSFRNGKERSQHLKGKVCSVRGVFFSGLRVRGSEPPTDGAASKGNGCGRARSFTGQLFRFQQLPAAECVPAAGPDRLRSWGSWIASYQRSKICKSYSTFQVRRVASVVCTRVEEICTPPLLKR